MRRDAEIVEFAGVVGGGGLLRAGCGWGDAGDGGVRWGLHSGEAVAGEIGEGAVRVTFEVELQVGGVIAGAHAFPEQQFDVGGAATRRGWGGWGCDGDGWGGGLGGAGEEEVFTFEGGVFPGDLAALGGFADVFADQGEKLTDFEAGGGEVFEQGAGERGVAAVAVFGGSSGGGGEGDQRAGGGADLGEAAGAEAAAVSGEAGTEWVVAAGVEEHQREPGGTVHLVGDAFEVDGFEAEVTFGGDVGGDREEPVVAAKFEGVAGVEEHGGVRASRAFAEAAEGGFEGGAIGVDDRLGVEAQGFERGGDILGIVRGVGQGGDVLVGADANDEGDAGIGLGRKRDEEEESEEQSHRLSGHGLGVSDSAE